jgi:hypothetical protein
MKVNLLKTMIIMAALLFSTTTVYSQTAYKNVYGTPNNEFPDEYLMTDEGTYFCGRTNGLPSLTLVDNCGNVVFSRFYNYQNFNRFTSMTFAPNGDILMHAVVNENWFVMRVDANGNAIWGKVYHNNRERSAHIIPSLNDTYFVVGWWSAGGTSDDMTVLKIDGFGNQLWGKRYNDVDDQVMDVISDQNGGLVACGGLHSSVDMFAIHLDQNGNIGPAMEYQQSSINRFEARAVTQTQSGEFLFLGVSSTSSAWTPTILTVLKTDANFNPLWQQDFNTGNALNSVSLGIQEGVNGHVYFTTKAIWAGGNYSITELDPSGGWIQSRMIPDLATVRFNLNGAEQYHLNDRLLIMGNTQTINPFGMDDETLEMVDLNLNLCDGPYIEPEFTQVPLINFQWSPSDIAISFQETPLLDKGEKYLEYEQICDCYNFFGFSEPIDSPEELMAKDKFIIYPNITSGGNIHLEYDLDEGKTARLEVVDLSTGREIKNLSIELNDSKEMIIDLGSKGLGHGIYQFRLIYSDKILTQRLIIQ